MKPETILGLVKESDRAKKVLAEEYSSHWSKYSYLIAFAISIMGILFLTSAITFIAKESNKYIGALYLFVSLVMTFSPWYFILRQTLYRKIQLLTEAILAVNDSTNKRD